MTSRSRTLISVVGGLVYCALWMGFLSLMPWLLDTKALTSISQAMFQSAGRAVLEHFEHSRIVPVAIISHLPAYWLYAGMVWVTEDLKTYIESTAQKSREIDSVVSSKVTELVGGDSVLSSAKFPRCGARTR